MAGVPEKLAEIPLDSILIGVQALRYDPEDDSIVELAQDIGRRGLLQPIGVSPLGADKFQLLWGGRRLAAHRRLRAAKILARVMATSDDEIKAVALVENLHRQQLSLTEEVDGVVYMATKEGKSVEAIASGLSKSRSWVLNRLMIPGLPDFLKEPLLSGDIKQVHVEILAKLTDESAQRYLVAQQIQNRWSALQLRQICEHYHNSPGLADVQEVRQVNQYGAPQAKPVSWECQACGATGPIEAFRLVRVCYDGCRQEPNAVGSAQTGGGIPGVEDNDNGPTGADDHGDARKA